jgi:hypothetical protein
MTLTHRNFARTFAMIAAAALIGGCGGGGGMKEPVALAPQIAGLGSLELSQDTTSAPATFRITDADTPVASLEIAVNSSDTTLLPLSGIAIAGTGRERTISVTPAAESVGSATVTVTVRDPGGLSTSAQLAVRVNPVLVSFKSLTNASFASAEFGATTKVAGVTVQPDADDDATAFDALLQ